METKSLSFEQMETIEGGVSAGCWWSVAGMIVTIAGATMITGIGGLLLFQAGLAAGAGGMMSSCRE